MPIDGVHETPLSIETVIYTHIRAQETKAKHVCGLELEKKKKKQLVRRFKPFKNKEKFPGETVEHLDAHL